MPNTSERKPAAVVMEEIHERVNMDLVDAITEAIKTHVGENDIEVRIVCCTLSYMLGEAIAQGSTHREICALSESYGAYIHNIAHSSLEETNPSSATKEGLEGLIGILFSPTKPN